MKKAIILTGDRPTGALHLGHYVGSLQNRVALQSQCEQYVMIADAQALTDNYDNPGKVRANITEVLLDYLAVGINPEQSTIFIQSTIPEIPELTLYYLNLVTLNRLHHNPTVKLELKQKGMEDSVSAGFMIYPVNQAADITAFKASLVPVGNDQLPMIEQTHEIVRKFNETYNCTVLVRPEALLSKAARLPGIDGSAKMGKSLGNAIFLSDSEADIKKKAMKIPSDPGHTDIAAPGKVEGNLVFTYLDIFDPDSARVAALKDHYARGGLGDGTLKKHLTDVLQEFIAPIRKRREEFGRDPAELWRILEKGSTKARHKAAATLSEVKAAMGLNYF